MLTLESAGSWAADQSLPREGPVGAGPAGLPGIWAQGSLERAEEAVIQEQG